MSFENISVSGLDGLVEQAGASINKVTDQAAKERLLEIKANLTDMRVALVELHHLEDEFKRGNIMSEVYLDRHKKLVRDFLTARDYIGDVVVARIAEKATSGEDRSKIAKFKEALKNNRDFLLNVSQFILSIVQLFGK